MSAVNNELALFQPKPTERAVSEVDWINFRPIGQISKNSNIEFQIPGTSSEYILLSKTRLHVKVRILRADGISPIDNTDEVCLTNISLHSLFRQVDVSLQQQVVTTTVGVNYPLKSYLDLVLVYGPDVAESQLQAQGFYKDSSSSMDGASTNSGYLQRRQLTRYGIADFEGPLHVDVCQQPKAILPGVQIGVKLFQSDDPYRLFTLSGKEYQVEITDAVLKVCHMRLHPSVVLGHNERLQKSPAIYPFWKSDIKTFTISAGSYAWSADDLWHSFVPSRIVVAFTASSAYSGDFAKNPFNFQNFNLNYLDLSVDGRSVPTEACTPFYQPNPDEAGLYLSTGYVHEYLSLFKNKHPQKDGNFIFREDFPAGYAIYVFDLKPGCDENLFGSVERGHTRISARFDSGLSGPVTAIAYGIFPSEFRIDKTRNILL